MQAYLRGLIAGLQPEQRRLVTLYYGAGLSQDEIAAMLSVSQRKISLQIKKLLSHLKSGLTRAGFSSPVEMGSILATILSTGWKLSPDVGVRIFEELADSIPTHVDSSAASLKLSGQKFSIENVLLASVTLIALLAVPTAFYHKATLESANPAKNDLTSSSGETISIPTAGEKRTWDLDSIASRDLLNYFDAPPEFLAGNKNQQSPEAFPEENPKAKFRQGATQYSHRLEYRDHCNI